MLHDLVFFAFGVWREIGGGRVGIVMEARRDSGLFTRSVEEKIRKPLFRFPVTVVSRVQTPLYAS